MGIVKLVILAVIGSFIALKLKAMKNEYATVISLATGILILFFVTDKLETITTFIEKIANEISLSSLYIKILFKLIGISYLCEFASGLCKDAGCQSIATQVEIAGKLSILIVSIPVATTLIETISRFLK